MRKEKIGKKQFPTEIRHQLDECGGNQYKF